MSKSLEQTFTEDRRLVVLRILLQSGGYAANEYMLKTMLPQLGHHVSSDRVHTDLAWLEEQQLLRIATVADVRIATLTERGQDVATGVATVPGVKRPTASD